jgi:DNA-binding response OmpR family regulator
MNKIDRILLVDDDPSTHDLVNLVLESAGIKVITVESGKDAIAIIQSQPVDLVILDIIMPEMDGLVTCRGIRQISDVPIILLSAKGQEQDLVDGFEAGAQDYVVKPFRPREFVARVQNILHRTQRQSDLGERQLAFNNLILDLDSRRVTYWGRNIQVTPLEFNLLQYLMQNKGVVLSKEDLLQNVWGYSDAAGDLNFIEAAVNRLRKKIEVELSGPHYIQTVWGAGYRFGSR